MGKPTKRQRKFRATGGIHGRLDKGTVARKGKLGGRKRKESKNEKQERPNEDEDDHIRARDERRHRDFTSDKNLGDLDVDSFFQHINEQIAQEASFDEESLGNEEEESSQSGGDSDDDNEEDAPDNTNNQLSDESSSSKNDDSDDDVELAEARMKTEMAKMKEQDPDFHNFLQENERGLLEFGEADADDNDGGGAAASNEQSTDAEPDMAAGNSHDRIVLTAAVLGELERGLGRHHGIKPLKKLVAAYRSACYLTDTTSVNDTARKTKPGESGRDYVIESSKVYNSLMLLCLQRCHEEFRHHLLPNNKHDDEALEKNAEIAGGNDERNKQTLSADANHQTPIDPRVLERADRWPDLQATLQSFIRSTLHVLGEIKEPQLLTIVLQALAHYVPLLTPFPRLADATLKICTGLWSAATATASADDYHAVRLHAFFRIRQLALTQPFPFVEDVLKKTYLAYAQRAKFGASASSDASTATTLTFLGNCVVELYSLDYPSSYQHAFVYIRQLALHLRAALQKKTPEAMAQVYCWQYLHCLKLWTAVLAHAVVQQQQDDSMHSLVYPLTEIILGVCRLAPSPARHLPLRFHCVRLLQQLAGAAQVFIPTTMLLLEILDWKEWYLKPQRTGSKSKKGGSQSVVRMYQLQYMLKLPKTDVLRQHEQLEAGMDKFFLLLDREVELYRYSAGFPEFSVAIVSRLRKFNKECGRHPRWRAFARATLDTIDKHVHFVVPARAKLQAAPKDVKELECLLPAGTPNMRERLAALIQKEAKALSAGAGTAAPSDATQDGDPETKYAKGSADESEEDQLPPVKKRRNNKGDIKVASAIVMNPKGQASHGGWQQEDQVHDGIDWSDDE